MPTDCKTRLDELERKHRRPCDARQWTPKKDPIQEVTAIARRAVTERDKLRDTFTEWADMLEGNWDRYDPSKYPTPAADDSAARYTIKTIRNIIGETCSQCS